MEAKETKQAERVAVKASEVQKSNNKGLKVLLGIIIGIMVLCCGCCACFYAMAAMSPDFKRGFCDSLDESMAEGGVYPQENPFRDYCDNSL